MKTVTIVYDCVEFAVRFDSEGECVCIAVNQSQTRRVDLINIAHLLDHEVSQDIEDRARIEYERELSEARFVSQLELLGEFNERADIYERADLGH